MLQTIPDDWELLHQIGPTGTKTSNPAPQQTRNRPPANLEAIHLLNTRKPATWWGLDPRYVHVKDIAPLAMLESWSRVIHEDALDLGLDHPELVDPPTIKTECEWLQQMLHYANAQQWATEFARDIATLARSLRAALGEHIPPAKNCPTCEAQKAVIYTMADTQTICLECEQTRPTGINQIKTENHPLATINQAATHTGISHWTIRSWLRRDPTLWRTTNQAGQTLIRVDDIKARVSQLEKQNSSD